MPVYEYKGFNAGGETIKGIVDAESAKLARLKLRRSGIFTTDIVEEQQAVATESRSVSPSRLLTRITESDKAVFTRQLATLLGAGIPVVEALAATADQAENPRLKRLITNIREKVNEGSSLANAMAMHPRVFEALYANMIRAGESSGALEVVLGRLADYMESSVQLKNKVSAAMIYPMIMMSMAVFVVVLLMTFVVPKMKGLFEEMGQDLPLPTQLLMGSSDLFVTYWWALLGGVVLLSFLWNRYGTTEKGRMHLDTVRLRLPIFGRLTRTVAVSRFARTLSTLISSGIPLTTSLEIVKNIVNNVVLANAVTAATESITQGASIADPLRRSGHFPPLLTHMIAIGERTGELELMLTKVSESYDNEIETTITKLLALLNPIMVLLMSGVVLFIVLAVLLPIFSMNELIAR